MSDRRAPIIAAVASVVLALLLMYFLVSPEKHKVAEAKGQLTQLESQTGTLTAEVQAFTEVKAAQGSAKAAIAAVDKQIPKISDLPGIIGEIQTAANESGIEYFSQTVGTPAVGLTGDYSTVPVNLSVSGSYAACTLFLYKLETFPRAAKVASVQLSPTAGPTGAVSVTMAVTMTLYTLDTSAGPASQPGPNIASPAPAGGS
jgi:type IV pilus assembly protein PilO